MTEYVQIDFTKKADPLPDSDTEDNKKWRFGKVVDIFVFFKKKFDINFRKYFYIFILWHLLLSFCMFKPPIISSLAWGTRMVFIVYFVRRPFLFCL